MSSASFYPRGILNAVSTADELDMQMARRMHGMGGAAMWAHDVPAAAGTGAFGARRDVWLQTQEGLQLAYKPAMDLYDEGRTYVLHIEVPGTQRDQIQVDVKEWGVCVQGEAKVKEEQRAENVVHQERKLGRWIRTIALPSRVKPEQAQAKLDTGILEIRVQKAEESKATKLKVQ